MPWPVLVGLVEQTMSRLSSVCWLVPTVLAGTVVGVVVMVWRVAQKKKMTMMTLVVHVASEEDTRCAGVG